MRFVLPQLFIKRLNSNNIVMILMIGDVEYLDKLLKKKLAIVQEGFAGALFNTKLLGSLEPTAEL